MKKFIILISLSLFFNSDSHAQYLTWVDEYVFHFNQIEDVNVVPDTTFTTRLATFSILWGRGDSNVPGYNSPYTPLSVDSLIFDNTPALWASGEARTVGSITLENGLYEIVGFEKTIESKRSVSSEPAFLKIECHEARVMINLRVK